MPGSVPAVILGVDVGGTFTDAVLLTGDRLVTGKAPTTPRDQSEGVVAAVREMGLKVPLVVRLEGTNVDLGKKILRESGLKITSAENLADAAQKIVSAVKESN